jgi:hypothetical protein
VLVNYEKLNQMKKVFSLLSLGASLIILSCNNNNKSKTDRETQSKPEKESQKKDNNTDGDIIGVSNGQISNNISIKATGGAKVNSAFLTYPNGDTVPDDNTARIGQKVQLNLYVDGWLEEKGKVFLGAGEKITTDLGEVVLDEPDMFLSYSDGISPEDAKIISIRAVITRMDRKFDFFVVYFRVWDKKGNGVITGNYKLRVK